MNLLNTSKRVYGSIKINRNILMFLLIFNAITEIFAQASGDFRSTTTGNWGTSTTWQRYNGSSWENSGVGANNPGQTPTATSSVWIQTAHVVTLAANEACANLHIATGITGASSTLLGKIGLATFTLSINGKMRCYFATLNTIPGTTSSSGYSIYPFTASTGKVSIEGSTRNVFVTGEWGATITTPTTGVFPLEINLSSNSTVGTFQTNIKCTSFSLVTGTISGATISMDNGTTGSGNATIASGTTLISSASSNNVFQRTGTTRAGTLTLAGTLRLTGATPQLSMNSITNTGTVEYTGASQTFIALSNSGAALIAYTNLTVSGTGTKTPLASTTVSGTLLITASSIIGANITINGTAQINGGGFTTSSPIYGSSSTLIYNTGGSLSVGLEWPIVSSPFNVTVQNSSTLSLGTDRSISGVLTVSSGILDLSSNQILGSGSIVINGTLKTSKAAGFSGTSSTAVSNSISSITLGSASIIDYNSAGNQTITAGNYANLSNSGNGDRTLENSGTIGVSGSFSPGSGNYTTTNSTVVYNGTSAQTAVALAPSSIYNNLTINNAAGVSMNADLNLEGALTLTNGVFTTTGYTFTFLSTQTQTARIAPVTGGSISGDVTIQRFVPGGDAGWTFIGMPATGRTIADWTDDITTSGFTGSTTGTGTFVSIYGYDETVGGNADASASYVGVTDASNAVDPKKGYFVYVADNATTVADKTLDITGPVLTGTQTFNVSYTANTSVDEDGWNLISNPYVSAIDWLSLNWTKTNIDDAIYIYDTETPQYVGSVGGVSYNGGNEIIASSQAFFVHANAASPVLSVSENAKSTLNPTYYRSSSTTPNVLRLQLSDANNAYVDETVFQSKAGASSNFDGSFDAYKLYSFDPTVANISTRMGGIEYVVNSVDVLNSNLDLDVKVNVPVAGTFTINFVGLVNYRNGVSCFTFEDKLTHTVIDLSTDSSYTFTSTIDTASAYARFVLHFGVETIVPSITPSATTLSYPGNTTVSFANNSTGASTYSWNFGDGSPLETVSNPSHTYTTPGIYTATLTARNAAGCSETTNVVITVENVTSVINLANSENITIGRDAQGVFANYNFAGKTKVMVNIFNMLGEQVGETQTSSVQSAGRLAIKTSELAKGMYTIEVLFDNKRITKKLDL
jgi:hypothetical protein